MKRICYLAMTAEEIAACHVLPDHRAFMACHFSPYGQGLTMPPDRIASDMMLIINDRIPISGHDPGLISDQIYSLEPQSLLLDLQRAGLEETFRLVSVLSQSLSIPMAVSSQYAQDVTCPVFVSPVPPDIPAEEWLQPWQGREIWLDTTFTGIRYTLSDSRSICVPLPPVALSFKDNALHTHYEIREEGDHITVDFSRTAADQEELIDEAGQYGVTRAIGLYQEWKSFL